MFVLRSFIAGVLAVAGAASISSGPVSAAPIRLVGAPVMVSGAVASPRAYPAADLDALPQVTVASDRARGGSVTGVSLQTLVARSAPRFDTGKNPSLRIAVTVRGLGRTVTFALGELDAGFGDHPALLTSDASGSVALGTNLVVPADRTSARSVFAVREIVVSVTAPGPVASPAGVVEVVDRGRVVRLSTAALARLPQRRETVTFSASGVRTSRTFTGPGLADALRSVGVFPPALTSVLTVTGIDGYAANVTLGEASVGGRPLLVALTEDGASLERPRLVPAGDVKGGRYVSDATSIVIRSG